MNQKESLEYLDPEVSVLCIAYNHRPYIEECLESIVSQETSFNFEIIIHDDCSTDGTTEFLKDYEHKHSNLRVIYEKENQYSKGIKITPILIKESRGKYLAFCECDDFYCDKYKLQKQYEAIKSHPNCIACIHDAKKMDETRKIVGTRSPKYDNPIQGQKEILYCVGHLYAYNSLFVKKISIDDLMDDSLYKDCTVGDIPIALHLSLKGSFFYIKEELSVYRMGTIGSWSKRMKGDRNKALKYANSVVEMLKKYDSMTNYILHEVVLDRIEVFEYQRVQQEGNLMEALSPRFRKRFFNSPLTLKVRLMAYFFLKHVRKEM